MYSFVLKKRIRKRTLIKPTLTWLKVLSSQSQFSNNKQAKYHNFIFPKVSPLIMSLKLPPEVRLMQSSEISRRSLKKWWKNLPAMFLDYQIIFTVQPSQMAENDHMTMNTKVIYPPRISCVIFIFRYVVPTTYSKWLLKYMGIFN